MEYPKRLMGWVREGNTPYEVRLNHEPNLFCFNRYVVYQISKLEALPTMVMFERDKCPEVKEVYYGDIYYWDGYILREGSEVMVEPVDNIFRVYNERGGVRLRLKEIPDNIR